MGCFNIFWFERLLIWLVVIGAIVAVLKLLVPLVLGQLGIAADLVVRIITIVVWAFVAIAIIYFAFSLLSCLPSVGLR
jgi:hypothetical protein